MRNFYIFFYFFIFFFSFQIKAHHKIYSAKVEEGRQSIEWRGHFNLDNQIGLDKEHHHVFETENSWNDHWQSEIEFHLSDKENTSLDFEKIEFQNQVEIIDKTNLFTSLYFSYNFVSSENKADEIEYKLLNEYTNSSVNFINNFILEKQVGKNSSGSTEFSLSNYLFFKQQIFNEVKLGLIGFSEFGKISDFNSFQNQEHQYGIQIEKDFGLIDSEIEFSIGFLFGLTHSSPNSTIIWNVESEF